MTKGFTLVEILVVFLVLSLLAVFASIGVPVLFAKAHDASRKASINRITRAVEEYATDTDCYPVSLPQCGNPFVLNDKVYLSNLPCDPVTQDSYVYVGEISSCPSWFQIYGNLEYKDDAIIDYLGCRNGCGPKCQFNYGASSTNQKLNPICKTELTPIPAPSPKASPRPGNSQYVCAPGGACEVFAFPEISGCPDIYLNDPTCQGQCSAPKFRCHDSRGKTN